MGLFLPVRHSICLAFFNFMNDTIRAGYPVEVDMPISTMVRHEDVVCTISKYTADLLFSLPTVEKYLLPMILEDDIGFPVIIFTDAHGGRWVKESDVIRGGLERMTGDYEFSGLMDDIDATKTKLIEMLIIADKTKPISFDDLQPLLLDKLCRLKDAAIRNAVTLDPDNLDECLSIISTSNIVHSIFSFYNFPFFSDRDIPWITKDIERISKISEDSVIEIGHLLVDTDSGGKDRKKVFSSLYEFVYIFDVGDKVKIGKSANPYRRLSDFHDGLGLKLNSFFLCEKSKVIETKAHYLAIGSVVSGEYFKSDCKESVKEFLGENSILSFDSRGVVTRDNAFYGSTIKRFSDLSDFIKK